VVGILLGFAAMMMIVLPETSLPEPAMALWVLVALIAPISFSSENVYLALRRPPASDPVILLCGMLIAGAIMLAPVVWATGTWVDLWHPWTEIEWWTMLLIAINTAYDFDHHQRIEGRSLDDHIAAARAYMEAVGDLF
jgi:drug/metabolite transporter (DMT)-like permease